METFTAHIITDDYIVQSWWGRFFHVLIYGQIPLIAIVMNEAQQNIAMKSRFASLKSGDDKMHYKGSKLQWNSNLS